MSHSDKEILQVFILATAVGSYVGISVRTFVGISVGVSVDISEGVSVGISEGLITLDVITAAMLRPL